MTSAEVITVLLGIHSAHINIQLYFVASMKVRLKYGVYCFLSWTVPVSSQMFADAQDQQNPTLQAGKHHILKIM